MKIYLIKDSETGFYKIGMTTQNINECLNQLQLGSSNKLILVDFYNTFDRKLESLVYGKYRKFQKRGEWFELPLEEVIIFKRTCRETEEMLQFIRSHHQYFQNN